MTEVGTVLAWHSAFRQLMLGLCVIDYSGHLLHEIHYTLRIRNY